MTAVQGGQATVQSARQEEARQTRLATGLLLSSGLGLAHGVSDCAAGWLIGGLALSGSPEAAGWGALAYNGLAFGAQPVAGWLADRARSYREMLLAGLALSGAAVLLFALQPVVAVLLAGLGSAALHAAGGGLALQATPGKAAGPGWFAAPGVLGLALGGLLAVQGRDPTWALVLALAGAGGLAAVLCPKRAAIAPRLSAPETHPAAGEWFILLLFLALAVRSTAWTGLHLEFGSRAEAFLGLALAAALGKALGGLLADWLAWRRWVMVALILAVALLALGVTGKPGNLALLAGVFFLQSLTPVLLAALGGALPTRPGLAAGLGLGLAVILGGIPALAGWRATLYARIETPSALVETPETHPS